MSTPRLSELSTSRQALVRRCQQIGYGKIVRFAVRDGEPVMLPETEVLTDVKLDAEEAPRPERNLKDFALTAQVMRLFDEFDAVRNAIVDHVEVRDGLPRRIVFKSRVQE
jgi:hypothetical protein